MEPDRSSDLPVAGSALDIRVLVESHYSAIYGYAFRLSGSRSDAEDLAQQTFLIAQQKLHQIREVDKADRWLFAVARSCYLKSRRRRRPAPATNLELNVDQILDDHIVESAIDKEQLQAAINQLEDHHKIVVVMFYFEELSYKEIAAELGIAIGTVMSRLARAKSRLRSALLDDSHGHRDRETASVLFTALPQHDRVL